MSLGKLHSVVVGQFGRCREQAGCVGGCCRCDGGHAPLFFLHQVGVAGWRHSSTLLRNKGGKTAWPLLHSTRRAKVCAAACRR